MDSLSLVELAFKFKVIIKLYNEISQEMNYTTCEGESRIVPPPLGRGPGALPPTTTD